MKYTIQGNCPYCDAEQGMNTPWAMHPIAMQNLKNRHDAGHPENQPIPPSSGPVWNEWNIQKRLTTIEEKLGIIPNRQPQ